MHPFIIALFLVLYVSFVSAQENQDSTVSVSNMKVSNPGSPVNSAFDDYNPIVSSDESIMVFSSRRADSNSDKKSRSDIYITHKINGEYGNPEKISKNINGDFDNFVAGLSHDGTQLFICRNDNGNKNLYMSSFVDKIWTKPVKLSSNINSPADETSASLSVDGSILYFSSNRPGGSGGFDIYASKKLPNGEWGEAQNIGSAINSKADEIAPYIHTDENTLFFSSNGHAGLGGFDIFFSSLIDDDKWSEPFNFGAPVNSSSDDIFYTPTAESKRAWFCSNRSGGMGGTDIYMIAATNTSKLLTAISGFVLLQNSTLAENVEITLTDNDTKEMIGKYIPNPQTGKFLIIIAPRKSHVMLCEAPGYFPYIANIAVSRKTAYQESESVVNIDTVKLFKDYQFYSFDFLDADTAVSPKAETKLEALLDFLRSSTANVEFVGNSSNLSTQRIQYFVNFFKKSGIAENRLGANYLVADKKNKIEIIIYNKSFEVEFSTFMKGKKYLLQK